MTKSEALALFGSGAELAKALGISRSAVSQWAEEEIPREHELSIRYELRPDIFGPPPAKAGRAKRVA